MKHQRTQQAHSRPLHHHPNQPTSSYPLEHEVRVARPTLVTAIEMRGQSRQKKKSLEKNAMAGQRNN